MKLNPKKTQIILQELRKVLPNGDLSINELASRTKLVGATIYRYIGVLNAGGIVKETRVIDKASLYQITDKGIEYLKKK